MINTYKELVKFKDGTEKIFENVSNVYINADKKYIKIEIDGFYDYVNFDYVLYIERLDY